MLSTISVAISVAWCFVFTLHEIEVASVGLAAREWHVCQGFRVGSWPKDFVDSLELLATEKARITKSSFFIFSAQQIWFGWCFDFDVICDGFVSHGNNGPNFGIPMNKSWMDLSPFCSLQVFQTFIHGYWASWGINSFRDYWGSWGIDNFERRESLGAIWLHGLDVAPIDPGFATFHIICVAKFGWGEGRGAGPGCFGRYKII